jgi:hypothetical protein
VASEAYFESVGGEGFGGSKSGGDGEAVVTVLASNPLPTLRKELSRPALRPRSKP